MKIINLLIFLVIAVHCYGEVEQKSTPNIFDFTTMSLDARHVALGGASTLIPSGGTGTRANPALASAFGKQGFGIAVSPLVADVTIGGVAGSYRLKNGIMLTPSFYYLSTGLIEGRDDKNQPLSEDVSPFLIDGGVSVGYRWISSFSSGISVRYAYEYLTPEIVGLTSKTDASALLVDGGIYFLPARNLALSGGFRNAGTVLKEYENDHSDVPLSVYSGIRYFTKGSTQGSLILEMEKERNFSLLFRPAFEVQFLKEILSFRAGTSVSVDDLRHFASIIGGETGKKEFYSKSESQLFSVGGGVAVPLKEKSLYFDFGTRILGDGMGLNFAFSGGLSF